MYDYSGLKTLRYSVTRYNAGPPLDQMKGAFSHQGYARVTGDDGHLHNFAI